MTTHRLIWGEHPNQAELDRVILANLQRGRGALDVARMVGTTLEYVQRICGEDGHIWEEYYRPGHLAFVTFRACRRCMAYAGADWEP